MVQTREQPGPVLAIPIHGSRAWQAWVTVIHNVYICAMSRQEMLAKLQKTAESIPTEQLPKFISIVDEIKEMLDDAAFDSRVKRVIDENRGLLQRLAK